MRRRAMSAPTTSNVPVPAATRTSTRPADATVSAAAIRADGASRPSASAATVTKAGYV